jgi:RIO kinase 1
MIQDVLSHVKGGKEASVYCCEAHPITGEELIAAKVYRPRRFRNLRNDAMYREGRPLLTGEGRAVKATDNRILRAVNKKSDFGVQVQHTSWLLYEYTTLGSLFSAGAAVPKPYGVSDNAILMGYQGDRQTAARTLSEVALEKDEAEVLYQEVVRNIELMLANDVIHGDLSAYNILYWQGKITLIDFPQVTNVLTNQNAAFILKRDIVRVCDYFSRLGVPCDAENEFERLWKPYQKLREIENALALP